MFGVNIYGTKIWPESSCYKLWLISTRSFADNGCLQEGTKVIIFNFAFARASKVTFFTVRFFFLRYKSVPSRKLPLKVKVLRLYKDIFTSSESLVLGSKMSKFANARGAIPFRWTDWITENQENCPKILLFLWIIQNNLSLFFSWKELRSYTQGKTSFFST